MLKTAGYSVGAVDGKFGSLTRGALLAFQADNGIQPTGLGDDKTVAVLNKSPPRPLDRERLSATENDLKERGSRTVIEAKRTKLLGWITGILGAVGIGNSAVVNSSGSNATAAPGLEAFLTDLQTFLANPTSPTSIAQLGEIRQNAAAVAEAVKAFKDSDLPTVVQKLEPLLSSVAPAYTLQTTRTVFDLITPIFQGSPNLEPVAQGLASIAASFLITPIFQGSPNLEPVAQGLASIAASFIPGLGGSVASIAIGFIAHYLGSKISQARVQEHREGSNLDR